MASLVRLAGWIAVSFLPALIGAPFTAPDWYRRLRRPGWAPPGWLFGPVWTLLYLLMAVAAWRVQAAGRRSRTALSLFAVQLALNAGWTPIFFGLRRIDLALVEIVATWFAIAATLVAFARVRLGAGLLLLPYLAWVTFASVLNWSIWRRNRDQA
jgi:tryptophan-rich sensory protein